MPINDEGLHPEITEREMPDSPEKPNDNYESAATKLEREAFDALERLVEGIELLPEYATKAQELLDKAREEIEKEGHEFLKQLQDILDIPQPNRRPNENALPIDLKLEEVVKPRAGDGIRFSLDHDVIGPNYVDGNYGYMFDEVKENYIKAQDAYKNGDKELGDTLMKNTEGMAWVIIQALETGTNDSLSFEWSKKRPEDIFEIVRVEMQQDAQKNPSERFSKN